MRLPYLASLLTGSLLLASGCGGSSSSSDPGTGEIEGLQTPSQVSVVAAQDEDDSVVGEGGITPGAGEVTFPITSDFATDPTNVWVYDPSMKPVDQVNEILCFIAQTGAAAMVNQGPYLAQVDAASCKQGQEEDDSSGQSSSNVQEFEIWTVDSMRATRTSDQLVSIWVPEESGPDDEATTIRVLTEISEGVSDENPFGIFSLNFAGFPEGATDPFMIGTLSTQSAAPGFIGYTFYQEAGEDVETPMNGDFFERTAVNVNMTEDSSEGVARISTEFTGNFGFGTIEESEQYLIAFDETNMLRSVGGNEVCLSRETFISNVWRYNLYYADEEAENFGDRVELNSGFGFRTADDEFGWVGYHGVWLGGEGALEDGDTIERDSFDAEADPEVYTVRTAPGRLIRNLQRQITLDDIIGKSFEWFPPEQFDAGPALLGDSGSSDPGGPVLIEWDGMEWMKTHVFDYKNGQFTELDTATLIDVSEFFWLGMWSQELNGSVNFVYGDDFVTVYEREFVTGASELFDGGITQLELHGYLSMLGGGISQNDADGSSFFLDDTDDVGAPHVFFFDVEDLTLKYAPDGVRGEGFELVDVGLAAGVTIGGDSPFSWGIRSGPMVQAAASESLESVYEVFGEMEFFEYETGPNPWNRFTGVEDADGNMVDFDPPLQFQYTHTTANDRDGDDAYDGQTYFVNYDGPGQLWGIPNEGVDLNDDDVPDRYYPLFSIADGALVGPDGTEYAVKALELEQQLAIVPGECDALVLTGAEALTLPTADDWSLPDIGDVPVVEDAPAVIGGVVQGAGS